MISAEVSVKKSLYNLKPLRIQQYRPGTRITRIGRINTDNHIRAYPRNPRHPCAIGNAEDSDMPRNSQFESKSEQESISTGWTGFTGFEPQLS
ncbi:MAG: hypothetical protein C3F06_05435 [Candidatus Methanoperedenaceae archaeon]|nr:MAG: hypothetical protein C3F06_05435 [Candidatus Methanoperedenaceae archaeon]